MSIDDTSPNRLTMVTTSETAKNADSITQQDRADPEIFARLEERIAREVSKYEILVTRYERLKKSAEAKHDGEKKAREENAYLAELIGAMREEMQKVQKARTEAENALREARHDTERVIRHNHSQVIRITELEQEMQKLKMHAMDATQTLHGARQRIDFILQQADQQIMRELNMAVGKLDGITKEEVHTSDNSSLKRSLAGNDDPATANPAKKVVVEDPRLSKR